MTRFTVSPAARLLLVTIALGAPTAATAQSEATFVYLVRHAERAEDGTNDPPISAEGEARAELVAAMLLDAGLTHIHTTDFRRTRATAAPIARETGIEVEVYEPRDLAGLAERLKSTPGRHLVVGHSNTTPQLVEALGGNPGMPIEEMEYDRAYVVVVMADRTIGSAIFRFGSD